MKLRAVAAFGVGAALLAWLVWRAGPSSVLRAIATLGPGGFALVLLAQLGLQGLAGWAWAQLGRGRADARIGRFLWARLVREESSQVLPFTPVGGLALGGRALALEGVDGEFAFASSVTDLTLEFTSQAAYVVLGAALLSRLRPGDALLRPALAVAAAVAVMALGLAAVRSHALAFGRRLLRRGAKPTVQTGTGTVKVPAWPAALAWITHLLAWMLTGAQTWITLRLLHANVTYPAALAIDGLTSGAKAVAFLIPGGLGVQEGALLLLGQMLGVPAPTALALSLVRRGRDLVLAAPVLTAWQLRHGSRIWGLAAAPGPVSRRRS